MIDTMKFRYEDKLEDRKKSGDSKGAAWDSDDLDDAEDLAPWELMETTGMHSVEA